jgi:hypothetical protein
MTSCSVAVGSNQCFKKPFICISDVAESQAVTKTAEQGDWSVEVLRHEAAKHEFTVCVQHPNHEGLLSRMACGMEREIPDAASAEVRLKRWWPNYHKPVNAHALARQFSLDDLLRVAKVDSDLEALLKGIGLMNRLRRPFREP